MKKKKEGRGKVEEEQKKTAPQPFETRIFFFQKDSEKNLSLPAKKKKRPNKKNALSCFLEVARQRMASKTYGEMLAAVRRNLLVCQMVCIASRNMFQVMQSGIGSISRVVGKVPPLVVAFLEEDDSNGSALRALVAKIKAKHYPIITKGAGQFCWTPIVATETCTEVAEGIGYGPASTLAGIVVIARKSLSVHAGQVCLTIMTAFREVDVSLGEMWIVQDGSADMNGVPHKSFSDIRSMWIALSEDNARPPPTLVALRRTTSDYLITSSPHSDCESPVQEVSS
jgi:hypothetical protein